MTASKSVLAGLDELPDEYIAALDGQHAKPAWPSLRSLIPEGIPDRKTVPHMWEYRALRPLLLRAGELTPIDRAERRVLMLSNPGLDGKPFATASLFLGFQLLLPGETAPNHRHSPSAVRMIVEGEGGYTIVEGQRLDMRRGDVILTPAHLWHEHRHEGTEPLIWLDALDAPLLTTMEASYGTPGELNVAAHRPDAAQTRFRRGGLVPFERLGRAPLRFPQFRYAWADVRPALVELAGDTAAGETVQLAYVNPETGEECMPTMGFSALMLRPGEEIDLPFSSASTAFLAVEGSGRTIVGDAVFEWKEGDVLAMPTHSRIRHCNASPRQPAFLIQIDDAPMQRRLGFYQSFR